jgi:hypothetical protein
MKWQKVGVFGNFCIGKKCHFRASSKTDFMGKIFVEKLGGRISDFNLNFSAWALAEKCQSICGL